MDHIYRVLSTSAKSVKLLHLTFIMLAILCFVFASPHAQAQGLVDLGALPANYSSSSSAWGISNDGVIVGKALTVDIIGEDTVHAWHAVKWPSGQITSIYSSVVGGENCAYDINSVGDAAGTIWGEGIYGNSAVRWKGESMEIMPPIPSGHSSRGFGINDSGWVVGDYIDSTLSPIWGNRAFLWKNNSIIKLPPIVSKGRSYAKKINNNGLIVGYSTIGESPLWWEGCVWFNGKYRRLPPAPGCYRSFAFDINDSNVIVGISDPEEWSWDGVLTIWKVAIVNGTDLQLSGPFAAPQDFRFRIFYESKGTPVAINNMNMVVGRGNDTLDGSTDLFVYQDGVFGNMSDIISFGHEFNNSNNMGIDINDSGQIVGTGYPGIVGQHGFLLTAKYISVNMPAESALFVAGETNLISWMHLGVNRINIYYQIGESPELHLIIDNYPAESNYFVWDVPDTLLSAKVKIRIEDANSSAYAESKAFRIKGYVLTRLNNDGEYERFRPELDGWQMLNDETPMWPLPWYTRFQYITGNDPNTHQPYPLDSEYPFANARSKKFVDWPLFTETFGLNQCYIPDDDGKLQYRLIATSFWNTNSDTAFFGSCFGFAQSSLLAFDRKDIFLSFFGLPAFDTLSKVPVSDSNRKVINRLYERQLGDDEDAYNVAASAKTATDVLADLKAMMLSDIDDHRSVTFFSRHAPTGGHTVLPYRVIKAPDWPSAYRVYTYDSNNPGDTSIFVFIDTLINSWYFADLNWAENAPGTLRLDRPASHYLEPPQLGSAVVAGTPLAAKANGNSDYMKILNSDAKDVWIVGMGESVKYDTVNGITISGPLAVWPIIPATGGPHRPLGFYLPRPCPDPYGYDRSYNVWLSQLGDSNVYVSFRTDSVIWNYSRHHADSTQMDCFVYLETSKEQGVVVYYGSEGNRTVDIGAILPGDNSEKALDVTILSIVPGNSIQTSYRQDGDFAIMNNGSGFPTYCNFRLTNVSTGGTGLFKCDSLYLDGAASYIIHNPNWDSLDTAPVKILIDLGGNGTIDDSLILNNQATDVDGSVDPSIPRTFGLSQNYPNPFNPATTIEYSLPRRSDVVIDIYNILGRKVRQLVNETKAAGVYQVTWNGTDQSGSPVSTGIYVYRIQAGDFVQTRKMMLIK